MSEFTTIHLGQNAKSVEDSPSFQPFSMVRIIVGEDENGTQIVYEAGEPSGRVLEVTNPWGTQQIANDMLAKIQGYQYKPFTADGALINPAAELGDAVTVGNVYSVINSTETTFSPIMSSTISAYEGSTIEHEYPYEPKENREIERRIGGIKTSLIVGLGRIESEITNLDNDLSSRITQTENSITSEVRRATAAEGSLSSRITQTANAITSEVTRATQAEGTLSSRITQTSNSITSEVTRATQAENALSSRITQTASEIRAEVNGIYADEWVVGTGPGTTYYYNPGDVVKVTNGTNVTYYKCIYSNDSRDNNKPGSGIYWDDYWEVVSAPNVQSLIDMGLDGITIGYKASDLDNSATITLNKGGIQMQAQTITMTNVVADSISANSYIQSPVIYDSNRFGSLRFSGQSSVGRMVYGAYSDSGNVNRSAFAVTCDPVNGASRLFFAGKELAAGNPTSNNIVLNDGGATIYAYGTWDFSHATVIGI